MPEHNIALFDNSCFILIDESKLVKKRPCDVFKERPLGN